MIRWVRDGKIAPDPWDQTVELGIHQPEALPVCHHCFSPHEHDKWFCSECGAAVGPYNNYLPYVDIFSQGEMLRAGTNGHVRQNFLTVAGYFLISLNLYFVFAPVYWYFLFRNFRKQSSAEF